MVSGTPLSESISDLLGELFFLRVSPFGAGQEDGFWKAGASRHPSPTAAPNPHPPSRAIAARSRRYLGQVRIAEPWAAKDEQALDDLRLLLGGVMMRHSKTQRHVDGAHTPTHAAMLT